MPSAEFRLAQQLRYSNYSPIDVVVVVVLRPTAVAAAGEGPFH